MADAVAACRAYLLTLNNAAVGTRIYGIGLPEAEVPNQPRGAVILRPFPATGAGDSSFANLQTTGVDIVCYGKNERESGSIEKAMADHLKSMSRYLFGDVLLHVANRAGSPSFFRDPSYDFPVTFSAWTLQASFM